MEKITKYLFFNTDKYKMMRSMGYDKEDVPNIYVKIYDIVKNEFLKGNYILKKLDISGQHISIPFVLNGHRYCNGRKYNCHVGCVVWPNGKIKVATPLILNKEIV